MRSPDFVDLLPGWGVREVTPIFASGGYMAKGIAQQEGTTITLEGTGFQGYETALYELEPREDGRGVRPSLQSVSTTIGDSTTTQTTPRAPLFQFPDSVRFIRILYLIRVSESDHNMAILGSDNVAQLNALTKQVQGDPAACHDVGPTYCVWVPQGIAVTPDMRRQ